MSAPLAVAHLDTGRDWRGGQAQVLLLARGLERRGVRNLVLAPRGPLLERAAAEGLATAEWSPRGEWDFGAVMRGARLLAEARVQVAHCHSAHAHAVGVPAARLAGVPAVVVSRRVDFAIARHPLSALKYRLPVDRYLCISRGVMEVMRAGGVPESRLALVPSGIEFPDPPPGPDLRGLLGVGPDAPIVGTVAALAPHKNHADLLRAAAEVVRERPDVHFAWVGDGECREALLALRSRLRLERNVHLLGFRDDAHALLRQFTVFALASWLEGLCTSLLDAQALGVPAVATRVGGIPDVIEDGVNGRLVPPRDPAALAAALIEALRRPDLRSQWVAAAQRSVQAFHTDRTVERTLVEYQAALGGRRRERNDTPGAARKLPFQKGEQHPTVRRSSRLLDAPHDAG